MILPRTEGQAESDGLAELVRQMDEQDMAAERAAVESIKELYEWRQGAASVEAEIRKVDPKGKGGTYDMGSAGPLRRWLLEHPDQPLYDNEAGLVAKLRSGGETTVWDRPSSIRERSPELYKRLEELGCFVLDTTRVLAATAEGHISASDVDPYRHRESRSPSLVIEKLSE